MNAGRLCFRLLILVLTLVCAVEADEGAPEPIERAHFIYYLDNPRYASLIDTILNRTRTRLIQYLKDSLSYRPAVHIVEDLSRFEKLVGGYFPDWGAAAAAPARRLMAVKSPDRFNLNRSLRELLAHEYAHLALAHRCRLGTPPRWFDEGLAMMVSMEWSWSDNMAMSKGAVFGQLIPLKEIERVNRFSENKAHLAYAESYLAVKYLFDEYGVSAVNTFLDYVARGKSLDDALMAATGSDYDDFDAEYQATLLKRFNVLSLFMDTIYFWVALAIVVIIGGILSYRRRRQYYKDWEEHEKLHSTDFDYGDQDNPEQIDDDEPWRQ
jgi:hypothetical protein